MVNEFKHKELDQIDKRLIRGLFKNKMKDFDEKKRQLLQSVSLYMRIRR